MEIRVSISNKGGFFDRLPAEVVEKNLTAAMYEAVGLLEGKVKAYTPQGVFGERGGGLRASIHGEVQGKGTPLLKGIVATNNVAYGEVVEKGRRPGMKMPPEGKLIRWMEVKLGLDSETAKKREFLLRRKIGKKGFPGARMFERALDENMDKLQAVFDHYGFNIAKELGQ